MIVRIIYAPPQVLTRLQVMASGTLSTVVFDPDATDSAPPLAWSYLQSTEHPELELDPALMSFRHIPTGNGSRIRERPEATREWRLGAPCLREAYPTRSTVLDKLTTLKRV